VWRMRSSLAPGKVKELLTAFTERFLTRKNILILYLLFCLVSSLQSLLRSTPRNSSRYNNYVIFERSFNHLVNSQDLYTYYPEEHFDLFKYTPTFSVFFGFFSMMPDWVGVALWAVLNALILMLSIQLLPGIGERKKNLILVIVAIELLTSIQNEQSNALMVALLVLSFGLLENKKFLLATLCISFTVFIKLFGVFGFLLLLFYPNKPKLFLYSLLSCIFLFSIPLLVVDVGQYLKLFQSYINMLSNDLDISYGLSVMGWLNSWFNIEVNKKLVVLIGAVIMVMPFLKIKSYTNYTFRYLNLAAVLIWVVIFNHKAESPTFIIAMTGVAMWFIVSEESLLNNILFVAAIILTSLSPTDVFPRIWLHQYVQPYTLKAVPCIAIWIKLIYDLFVLRSDSIREKVTS
jgi:hypothetical protein